MKSVQLYLILFAGCLSASSSFAQKGNSDTGRRQVVDITSSYKPVLRNAVKINFSASNLNADSTRPRLQYSIPSQNLFYTYQPLPVKPLAIQQDTALDLGSRNYIKLGFGNYTTPYAKGALSFGDGKTELVNLYGDYISSKGKIQYQDCSQFNLKGTGSYFTPKSEIYAGAAISQNIYYMYGYDHTLHPDYIKDSLKQNLSDLSLKLGVRNKTVNGTGINYDPNVEVNFFSNKDKLSEKSFILNLPIEKVVDNVFTIKVSAKADATSYSTNGLGLNTDFQNNIYQIAPALEMKGERAEIHAGIAPTWDNSKLNTLPDIYAEIPVKDKVFLVQVGWVGQVIKNTYQNLSQINPYLRTLTFQQNTKEVELYGGIKATVGKHFNFSAKAGFVTYRNLPLFVNDSLDGKSFYLSYEGRMSDLRFHADMSFISQDKFTITTGFNINGYTGLHLNDRAYGMIPIQLTASMRWWAYKHVLFKADLNAFGGAPYLIDHVSKTLSGGTDLSAGIEFIVSKQFSAWLDLNNLLNDQYQRWYNYRVYGLNVLAGVIYKF